MMNPQRNFGENPEESSLIDRLGDTISNLRTAVKDAFREILAKEGRVSDTTDLLVQQYRVTAIMFIKNAETTYQTESEDAQIVALMKQKMHHSLREYDFFTLIAEILEREREVATLEEKIRQIDHRETSYIHQAFFGLLSGVSGYSRKGVLQKHIQHQLINILTALESVIQDDHFNAIPKDKHDIFHLKWKRYVAKARALDVRF